jgi:hypothetical protein
MLLTTKDCVTQADPNIRPNHTANLRREALLRYQATPLRKMNPPRVLCVWIYFP